MFIQYYIKHCTYLYTRVNIKYVYVCVSPHKGICHKEVEWDLTTTHNIGREKESRSVFPRGVGVALLGGLPRRKGHVGGQRG